MFPTHVWPAVPDILWVATVGQTMTYCRYTQKHLQSSARKGLAHMQKASPNNTFMKSIKSQKSHRAKLRGKGWLMVWSAVRILWTALYRTATGTNWKPTNKCNKTKLLRSDAQTQWRGRQFQTLRLCILAALAALLHPGAFSDLWCFGFWSGCKCEINQSRHIYATNIKP